MVQASYIVSGRGQATFVDDTGISPQRVRVNVRGDLGGSTLPRSRRYNPTYYLVGHVSLSACDDVLLWEHWINFQDQAFNIEPFAFQDLRDNLGAACQGFDPGPLGDDIIVRWQFRDQVVAEIIIGF